MPLDQKQIDATANVLRAFFEQSGAVIEVNGSEFVTIHSSFSLDTMAEFLLNNQAGVRSA